MLNCAARALIVLAVAATLAGGAQQQPPPPQRPPVFRAGAHYVRVDAYPTSKDGRIVEGLTRDDFEIYEDGNLQEIENAEFVEFDTWTPEAERKDPRTQQDAYDLAADPSYRVFVIVMDRAAYDMEGQHYLRGPLHAFIERNLGPHDLFGLLTTENEWTDLVLGQTTTTASAELDSRRWLDTDEMNERFWPYYRCGLGSLIGRKKLDDTYALLEGLVRLLGAIRQERKGIVFVTNGLAQPGVANASTVMLGLPQIPRIPRIGGSSGGFGGIARGDRVGGQATDSFCNVERLRLMNIDFGERFRDLLKAARQGNVSFYPVSPLGLQTVPFNERGGANLRAYRAQLARSDSLKTLASETGGIAVVNTNDLAGGMRRISADIQAYYVLGYYTNNTKWDGGLRSIKVRLKPKGDTIRARKQYRAPTMEEIAALSSPGAAHVSSAEETALAAFARVRSDAPFVSYAAREGDELSVVLEASRGASAWPAGTEVSVMTESADGEVIGSAREVLKSARRVAVVRMPLDAAKPIASGMIRVRSEGMVFTDRVTVGPATTLVGDPIAFRNGTPTAVLWCARTDGVHIEWPVLAALATKQARLLDRRGQPLSISLNVVEKEAHRLVTEFSLAPLVRGDYIVELVASGGAATERKLLPLRIQ